MEEADTLATRAAILSRCLLAIGSTQALRNAYSAQYHVSLILATAPLSLPEEVGRVEEWVQRELGPAGAMLEGANIGGQVRFTVPADQHSARPDRRWEEKIERDKAGESSGTQNAERPEPQGGIAAIIGKVETAKADLGLGDYTVGGTTLEQVFMSVVKDNHVLEEDEKVKRNWWQW
jgi:ATP-binding cassette, subfamily A (ABC1), member 3